MKELLHEISGIYCRLEPDSVLLFGYVLEVQELVSFDLKRKRVSASSRFLDQS